MKCWTAMTVLALLASTSALAEAQGPGPIRWARSLAPLAPQSTATGLLRPLALRTEADSTVIPPTHWKQGALLGGGAFGILGALSFAGLSCSEGPCHNTALAAVGGFALFGLFGFGLGALIGGQFPMAAP